MTMTETHAEQFVSTLCDRTIGTNPSIVVGRVFDAQIPPGVRRYVTARVAAWLEEDLKHAPRTVNLDRAGVHGELTSMFLKEIAVGVEMKRDDFLDLLKEAVMFTESYLTRPRWTLLQLFPDSSQRISLHDLHTRLDCCADYAYFGRLLEGVIVRRNTREISVEELARLVDRIDDQVVQQHSARELALLAKPIFDFFCLHDAGPDEEIPLSPVLTFFEDKNMKILKEYIESICRIRKTTTLSQGSLAMLIEKLGASSQGSAAGLSESKVSPRAVENDEAATGQTMEAPQPDIPEPAIASSSEEVQPRIGSSLPDVRTFMTAKQQQRFIRRVFKSKESDFFSVVAALNSMNSWGEASSYLADIYRQNRLDPFADDVVEFTDLIERRFTSSVGSSHEIR